MLEKINSPADLKELSISEEKILAEEIRTFLVDHVSGTGGHLASNLGIVELTIALHKIFDSPKDKIIWDVGHQAYVHKILTGRKNDFDNLRKLDGLSGFPKRAESQHDVYDTGHSSTSLAAALGMATARDISGEKNEVVAVVGDGSITGGPAFEGLNVIGQSGTKVIVILNDNGMSISKNIGGISEHLGKLRTSDKYINVKEKVKSALDKIPVIGDRLKFAIGGTKEKLKYAIINQGVLFEELGLTYIGPISGHDLESLEDVFNLAKSADEPVLIHVITQKGKGYSHAEKNPDRFHGIGPFDKETGRGLSGNKATYSDLFGDALTEVADKNKFITGISAAMIDSTGLGIMKNKFPERVFDMGIAEAGAVIFAAGQALNGIRPVVAVYSSFLQRAYDEIMEDVCMQNLPVIFAIDRAGLVGEDGETHQGIFDISYLMTMPNMTIFAPCDGVQLKEMLEYAVSLNSPVAIRYPRGTAITEAINKKAFDGKNTLVKEGKDAIILAVGTMLSEAIEASEILMAEGLNVGIIDVAVVRSMDGSEWNNINFSKDIPVITLEDNIKSGGFGEHFLANHPEFKISIISWPDRFIEQGDIDSVKARYGMDAEGIAKKVAEQIEK